MEVFNVRQPWATDLNLEIQICLGSLMSFLIYSFVRISNIVWDYRLSILVGVVIPLCTTISSKVGRSSMSLPGHVLSWFVSSSLGFMLRRLTMTHLRALQNLLWSTRELRKPSSWPLPWRTEVWLLPQIICERDSSFNDECHVWTTS